MARPNKIQYKVKHPEMYIGDVNNIISRSSWELALMNLLDGNSNIEAWSSEEIVIPYRSPLDYAIPNKLRNYYVDFAIKTKDGKTILIEVKPFHETQMPVPPKRKTKKAIKRYESQKQTYLINQAKWNAAKQVAEQNGATFQIFTEHELRALGLPI